MKAGGDNGSSSSKGDHQTAASGEKGPLSSTEKKKKTLFSDGWIKGLFFLRGWRARTRFFKMMEKLYEDRWSGNAKPPSSSSSSADAAADASSATTTSAKGEKEEKKELQRTWSVRKRGIRYLTAPDTTELGVTGEREFEAFAQQLFAVVRGKALCIVSEAANGDPSIHGVAYLVDDVSRYRAQSVTSGLSTALLSGQTKPYGSVLSLNEEPTRGKTIQRYLPVGIETKDGVRIFIETWPAFINLISLIGLSNETATSFPSKSYTNSLKYAAQWEKVTEEVDGKTRLLHPFYVHFRDDSVYVVPKGKRDSDQRKIAENNFWHALNSVKNKMKSSNGPKHAVALLTFVTRGLPRPKTKMCLAEKPIDTTASKTSDKEALISELLHICEKEKEKKKKVKKGEKARRGMQLDIAASNQHLQQEQGQQHSGDVSDEQQLLLQKHSGDASRKLWDVVASFDRHAVPQRGV